MTTFVGLEYQALAAMAGPATTAIVLWLLRQLAVRLRDRRVADEVTRLVRWAQQAIPDTSERYVQVAGLLSRRFPMLSGEQIEVLIESEVHALKTLRLPATGGPATDVPMTPPPSPVSPSPMAAAPTATTPLAPAEPATSTFTFISTGISTGAVAAVPGAVARGPGAAVPVTTAPAG